MLRWVIKALEDSREAEQRDIGSVYTQAIDSMLTLAVLDHNTVGDILPGLNPGKCAINAHKCNYTDRHKHFYEWMFTWEHTLDINEKMWLYWSMTEVSLCSFHGIVHSHASKRSIRHGMLELFQASALLAGYIRLWEVWFFPLKIKNLKRGKRGTECRQILRANEWAGNRYIYVLKSSTCAIIV